MATAKTPSPKSKTKKAEQSGSVSAVVVDTKGKEVGVLDLPQSVFGAKINPTLMAQAVRVYLANQREGSAATKTRGMVEGSTRKIFRQKGTGRARHGSIRANTFVGGGVVFGPVPHSFSLSLSKALRRLATVSAFSSQRNDGNIHVGRGFEGLAPKTKVVAGAFVDLLAKGSVLLVASSAAASLTRAVRNIQGVQSVLAKDVSTYHILSHKTIVLTEEAVQEVQKRFESEQTV